MAEARVDALTTNEDEIRIVTCGLSRAGITATGNAILGYRAFKATSTCCEKITGVVDGRNVSVIDSPGCFDQVDAQLCNDETGQKLLQEESDRYKRLSAPGPHVFLYVIQMLKYTLEEKMLVELLGTMRGLPCSLLPNAMFLFTHGGDLDLQHCSVEDCWKAFPKLHRVISKYAGDVCCHVFNTEDPSRVTELLEKTHQLVMKNGGGYVTKEMIQKQVEVYLQNEAIQEELARVGMELDAFEDLEQAFQTLRKRFDEEATKQESDQVEKLTALLKERDRELQNSITAMEDSKRQQQKLTQNQRESELEKNQDQRQMEADEKQSDQVEKLTALLKERERELQNSITAMEESKREQQKLAQDQKEHAGKLAHVLSQMKEREDTIKEMEDSRRQQQKVSKNQRDHAVAEMFTAVMKEMKSELDKNQHQRQMEADEKCVFKTQQHPTQIVIAGAENRLKSARKEFIQRMSDPILKKLLDELLDADIIMDEEMDTAMAERLTQDKARHVIDMVRKKGNKASSFMIEVIYQLDHNLCDLLQLKPPPLSPTA